MVTYIDHSSTDDIFGTIDVVCIEELDAQLSDMSLGGGAGLNRFGVTTLGEEPLDFCNDWCSLDRRIEGVAVVVDADDDLTLIVGDLVDVEACLSGIHSWGELVDLRQREKAGRDVESTLGITDIRKGDSEETTIDALRSIDGADAGKDARLKMLVASNMTGYRTTYFEGLGNSSGAISTRDTGDQKSTSALILSAETTLRDMDVMNVNATEGDGSLQLINVKSTRVVVDGVVLSNHGSAFNGSSDCSSDGNSGTTLLMG